MSIMLEDREVVAYAKGGLEIFRGMLSDFPTDIIAQAAAYAIHKKCQDASGGDSVTEADAKAKAAAVIAGLKAGTWAKRGGGARAATEEAFIIGKLVAHLKAAAKAAKASPPDDNTAKATAAAIMRSDKPKAQALVAQFKAMWAAKGLGVDDLI